MSSPLSADPTPGEPRIEIVPGPALSPRRLDAVAVLCERAYDEDLRTALADLADATHVLGTVGGVLVSHACWVPRTLGYGGPPARWPADPSAASGTVAPLRAAYVELVATDPPHQGRGYASAVLHALAAAVAADRTYDAAVLSPSDPAFYARLGWESWRGPLFEAARDGRVAPSADEEIMVLRLPHGAPLDLTRPLVAPWRPGEVW